jgi:transposase InsO family protein
MVAFIDDLKVDYGVESICRQLPIAPSTFYEYKAREADEDRLSPRIKRDRKLCVDIQRVWKENYRVYGARKIWKQLNRETIRVARCTVERLMKQLGVQGVVRGRRCKTTISNPTADHPLDLVNRQFMATCPNQLWVADFTYVATWSGFVYVAFITDVFARKIVGWRVSTSMATDFVLDALEQAIWSRKGSQGVKHHSDKGSQYLSIRYTDRLMEAGIEPSVGSTGDAYDNALAETINGLFKTEVIHHRGPWKGLDDVEYATLEWVDWFNNRRLLEPIGYIPPAELESNYYRQLEESAMVA